MGAWLRRIVVSIGIGGMSYLIMLGIMVLSVVYDRELEPVVTYAFDTGRRIIGALELCCRRGEMLLIQNKRVNWETHQIGIPGATAKDKENRRIPFNPCPCC